MRRLLVLALVAGCAAPALLTRETFVGTSWVEFCPNPEIWTAFVRFDPDGRLAWSYEHPDSVRAEDVHRWAVRADTLYLEWSNGTAGTSYTPTAEPGVLGGVATFCPEGATITRIR
ncbi:MAG: hypothetical protein AAGJ11_11165 [Bacteroidota bacterium]